MKKFLVILAIILGMTLLTGCGKGSYGTLSEAVSEDIYNEDLTEEQRELLINIGKQINNENRYVDDEYKVEAYLALRDHVIDNSWYDVDWHTFSVCEDGETMISVTILTNR